MPEPLDLYRDQPVLITGGLGFIGSSLARRLVELGAKVTLVDSLIPEYGGNWFNIDDIADRVDVSITDVRDAYAMRYHLRDKAYLFNLAGQTSHMDSMRDPQTDLEINAKAQLSILEAARLHNPQVRIVFASTRQIYGKPDALPVDETHALRPVDVNGINKIAGEHYHLLYHRVHDIPTTALRLTNTYGPGMRVKDARQTFLGIWIRRLCEGEAFEVWGGEQKRDYTYVDDCVDAFLLAGASDAAIGQVYNVGGEGVYSLSETAKTMIDAAKSGQFVTREFPADRKRIDIGDYVADDRKLRRELGWEPRVTLREGFERSVAYYRENLHHYLDAEVNHTNKAAA